jgi:lactoylglutathione lyase
MKIEHLAIWVKDLEKMRAFYEQYFEGKPNEKYVNPRKNFESYFLKFSEGSRLELMKMPTVKESENELSEQYIGITHFAMSVGSKEKVDDLTEILRKSGIKIIGEPRWTGDGYYESVILDPEHNRVEITI